MLDAGNCDIKFDHEHSSLNEDRWQHTGIVEPHGLVMVVTEDVTDEISSIISARKVEL